LGRRRDDSAILVHGGRHSPADGSSMTIRIRYRILNARLAGRSGERAAEWIRLTMDGG